MTDEKRAKILINQLRKDKKRANALIDIKNSYRYVNGTCYYLGPCDCLSEEYCYKGSRFSECEYEDNTDFYWIDFDYDNNRTLAYLGDLVGEVFELDLWCDDSEDIELGKCIFDELIAQNIIPRLTEKERNEFEEILLAQKTESNCAVCMFSR